MTTNTIENTYNEFRTATSFPPEYIIDFFTRKAVLFNNTTTFNDGKELKLYTELIYKYLNGLFHKDRYNETADTAIKHLKIIDSEIDRLNLTTVKDDWYFGIIGYEAMALYHLRDFKHSTPLFRQLTEYDNKSDSYKKWLSYSLYGQRMWISKTIMVISCLLIVVEIFFKEYIPSSFARLWIDGIGFVGLTSTLIYDYYIKRSFRKIEQK